MLWCLNLVKKIVVFDKQTNTIIQIVTASGRKKDCCFHWDSASSPPTWKCKRVQSVLHCVFVHNRAQLKGSKNGFSVGTVNFEPNFCPLAKLCFFPAAPAARRLSGGALKHNTPNEMWLVLPYCSIYTGWDDIEEEMQKCAHLLLDEVWWLSKPKEEAV